MRPMNAVETLAFLKGTGQMRHLDTPLHAQAAKAAEFLEEEAQIARGMKILALEAEHERLLRSCRQKQKAERDIAKKEQEAEIARLEQAVSRMRMLEPAPPVTLPQTEPTSSKATTEQLPEPTPVAPPEKNQPSPLISQAPATPQEQAEPEARPDLSMLATPEQLIQAFGRFTGMDNSWFKNLKDYPELEKARKLKGQGGRGHIEPPFFCPYEVMQWLMTKPRKNSRRCAFLTEDKPWQLLKSYFPRVYDMNQGYSPLNDD